MRVISSQLVTKKLINLEGYSTDESGHAAP